MTHKQIEEFIGLFDSAQKIESDYRKYVKLSMEKDLNSDEELRNLFDNCIFRAYELYNDIKVSTHLFVNQKNQIDNVTEYLSWELFVNDPWKKFCENKKVTIKEAIETARNKDNHPIKHDKKNLLILYKQCINDGHITFLVKLLEGIMTDRLNELSKEDKEKIIALNPKNIIWLENAKLFAKSIYDHLKELNLPEYSEHIEQLCKFLDFELTPENVKIIIEEEKEVKCDNE